MSVAAVLVGVELRDIVADVLVVRVPEQIELRSVGPEDEAIRTNQVQPFGGVLEEFPELLLVLVALGKRAPKGPLQQPIVPQPRLQVEVALFKLADQPSGVAREPVSIPATSAV